MSTLAVSGSVTPVAELLHPARHLRAIRSELRELERYAPPLADRTIINLSLNEHYARPSPLVQEALRAVDPMRLVTYDTELEAQLRARIAARAGVGGDNVLVFAGSSSALQLLFASLSAGTIVLPSLCWTYYRALAGLSGHAVADYAVGKRADEFHIEVRSVDQAIRRSHAVAAVFINPHMPTGALVEAPQILACADGARDTLLLVDEAYHGFSPQAGSLAGQVVAHPNVVVARTLSKHFGLAGIRIGYLIASAPVIEQLSKAALPFSVPFLSARLALAALDSEDYYRAQAVELMAVKDGFARRLAALPGVQPYRSHGNFLLVELADEAQANHAERAIATAGILVRSARSYGLPSFLRISIGSAADMDRIASALERSRAAHA